MESSDIRDASALRHETCGGTCSRTGSDIAPGSRPVHGGIKPADLRALGLNPEDVLDFSASISPLGPPQGTWEALHNVDLTAYPDPVCLELKEALSRHLSNGAHRSRNVLEECILVGNGSTELIHLLTRAYLESSPGSSPG